MNHHFLPRKSKHVFLNNSMKFLQNKVLAQWPHGAAGAINHVDVENCLGETRRRPTMERAVMRRRRAGLPAGVLDSANDIRDDRTTGRPESVPVPVELGLEEFGGGRCFDRSRR